MSPKTAYQKGSPATQAPNKIWARFLLDLLPLSPPPPIFFVFFVRLKSEGTIDRLSAFCDIAIRESMLRETESGWNPTAATIIKSRIEDGRRPNRKQKQGISLLEIYLIGGKTTEHNIWPKLLWARDFRPGTTFTFEIKRQSRNSPPKLLLPCSDLQLHRLMAQ